MILKLLFLGGSFPEKGTILYLNVQNHLCVFVLYFLIYWKRCLYRMQLRQNEKKIYIYLFNKQNCVSWKVLTISILSGSNQDPFYTGNKAKPKICSSARLHPSSVLLEGSKEVTSRHCLWSYLKQSWQLGTSAQQLNMLASPQATRVASWAPSELVNSSHIAGGAHTLPLLCQLICSSHWNYFCE